MQTVITDWETDSEFLPSTYMRGKIFIILISRHISWYSSFECLLCCYSSAKMQNIHLTFFTADSHSVNSVMQGLTQMILHLFVCGFFITLLILVGSLYVQGCQWTEYDQANLYSQDRAAELEQWSVLSIKCIKQNSITACSILDS